MMSGSMWAAAEDDPEAAAAAAAEEEEEEEEDDDDDDSGDEPQFMSHMAGHIARRLGLGSFARTSQRPSCCPKRKLESTQPEV